MLRNEVITYQHEEKAIVLPVFIVQRQLDKGITCRNL